jgi:hypothetical protein
VFPEPGLEIVERGEHTFCNDTLHNVEKTIEDLDAVGRHADLVEVRIAERNPETTLPVLVDGIELVSCVARGAFEAFERVHIHVRTSVRRGCGRH